MKYKYIIYQCKSGQEQDALYGYLESLNYNTGLSSKWHCKSFGFFCICCSDRYLSCYLRDNKRTSALKQTLHCENLTHVLKSIGYIQSGLESNLNKGENNG